MFRNVMVACRYGRALGVAYAAVDGCRGDLRVSHGEAKDKKEAD